MSGSFPRRYVGLAVRRHRKLRGMTLQALAIAAGLTTLDVRSCENGSGAIPDTMLRDLAEALDCDLEALLGDDPCTPGCAGLR